MCKRSFSTDIVCLSQIYGFFHSKTLNRHLSNVHFSMQQHQTMLQLLLNVMKCLAFLFCSERLFNSICCTFLLQDFFMVKFCRVLRKKHYVTCYVLFSFFQPGNTLCFQVVIISTATRSYTVHIYKTLDFSQVHFDNVQCLTQAVVCM